MTQYWQYAKSTDSGVTWTLASPFGSSGSGFGAGGIAYCYASKPGLEVIGGYDYVFSGKLGRSTDEGSTWTVTSPSIAYAIAADFSPDGNTLAICGGGTGGGDTITGGNEIAISTDDGDSWTYSKPMWDASHGLTNFWSVNPASIAFGSDFIVAVGVCETASGVAGAERWRTITSVSTDNGSTWTSYVATPFSVTTVQRSIPRVIVLPDDTIVLVGIKDDNGSRNWMATSSDQGANWSNLQVPPGDHVACNSSGNIICAPSVLGWGYIGLSTDSAASWSTLAADPFDLPGINDVAISDTDELMLTPTYNRNRVAISNDVGESWTVYVVSADNPDKVEHFYDCSFGSYVAVGAGYGDPSPPLPPPPPIPSTSLFSDTEFRAYG